MIANYHTHTWRCRHAYGTEEEYIQKAIASGMQVLGFSDHTPYWFEEDYYSTFRMFPEQLDDYVQTVLQLKKQYTGKIEIPLGLEVEYYPKTFRNLMDHLNEYPIEYMILGQHYIGEEIGEAYLAKLQTGDPAVLEQYCNQTMDALYTGLFSYFAHPDILGFLGDPKAYKEQMRRLCRAAKQCDIPLEINLQGQRRGRHYPNPVFWEIAAEEGCKIVIGCDAHKVEDIVSPEEVKVAENFAAQFDIQLLPTIELRPIK